MHKLGSAAAWGTIVLSLMVPAGTVRPVYAAETDSAGAQITIEKPSGWKQGDTTVAITVDASHLGDGISVARVEAKVGDGEWQDVTGTKSVSISRNSTVYVRVTDSAGNVYEQNRSVKCYDAEKPTLEASLSDGVLTVIGHDSISGVASVTVNGTTYTELNGGELKVRLEQKEFTAKTFTLTCSDAAGNTSDTYTMTNPYYEWAVREAQRQAAESTADGGYTTTDTAGGSGESEPVSAPLPQDAQPTEPTSATGTVEERTVTGIEEELAETGESAESITQTAVRGGKEFYTISTKSGKIFYLIVDNDAEQDNVYFLTEVSENDLLNFTLSDTVTLPDVDMVYAEKEKEKEPETEPVVIPTEVPAAVETEEPKMPEERSGTGNYLLIGLIAAGIFGGAYYFKIYRPKKDQFDDEEYEDEYEEEEPAERDDVPVEDTDEEPLADEEEESE